MTISIKFLDPTTKTEININKDDPTSGINLGVVRKGQQSEVKSVILKNLGNETAKNLSIKGATLNALTDTGMTQEEYNKQILASTWKYVSLLPNKNFVQNLVLPDIPAGQTMLGKKEIIDDFANAQLSNWATVTNTSLTHTWSWADGRLKCIASASSYGRVDANGWGSNLNYDMTIRMSLVPANNGATGSSLGYVVLRAGGNTAGTVDQKGYCLIFKRAKNATLGTDTIRVDMYHGEGVTTAGVSQLTNLTFTSMSINYIDYAPIRIKLWNNANGNPEIKVWYNNINDTDTPWQWANNAYSYIDTNNLYTKAGKTRVCFGVGATNITFPATFELEEATLLTDDPEGKVYFKTLVGDGAEDNVTYKSSLELSYDPPTI